MDVSIIFVNYKTKNLTINAIKSVIEQTKEIKYEIFVVDNASNDGSIEAISKEFPNLHIIKNSENKGFGAANNLAIQEAKGKYILCLNTDTILLNNAIKIMFDFMEKEGNENVGVCGGYLTDEKGIPCICGGYFPGLMDIIFRFCLKNIFPVIYTKYISSSLKSNEVNLTGTIDHIIGADIFFRKSVLDIVGNFDENFFMYREETDLCKRINKAGFKINFVPQAKIMHLEGKSTRNSVIEKKKMFKKSDFYYYKKHYSIKVYIIKIFYVVFYLFDWLINKNNDSKKMLCFIFDEC